MNSRSISFVVASAAILVGCVAQDVRLEPQHIDAAKVPRQVANRDCTMPPFTWTDRRPDQSLGGAGVQKLLYDNFPQWMENNLRQAAQVDEQLPPIHVELRRSYVEAHPSSLSFHVVLSVTHGSDTDDTKVYRGTRTGIVWWGNKAEIGNFVEHAGGRAVAALIEGEGQCAKAR
jgi:hypothetical protein